MTPSPADDFFSGLRQTVRRLVVATVLLVVLELAIAGYAYWQANTANEALCALRADLALRAASSQAFLDKHPQGIPGIPAATIRDGIVNQQRTISALSVLHC